MDFLMILVVGFLVLNVLFNEEFKTIRNVIFIGIAALIGWNIIDDFFLKEESTSRHWTEFVKERRVPERTADGRYILDQKQIDEVYQDGVFDEQDRASTLSEY